MNKESVPTSEQRPEKATIKLGDFTYEILEKVVRTYNRIVGGRGSKYLNPNNLEQIKSSLNRSQPFEYRYGSKLSPNSKLWIEYAPFSQEITFSFDPNIPMGDEEKDKLAEKLE